MNAPVLVTGGTGTIGSHVVPMLRQAEREVRILSR
ncbi:MAG TPA: NAD-dependent epimerase/dehydratase family protein, partial [Humibacter sp.]|nr:NAD-dependent epimerase/dehydratase family protein [Humibacter sp.]